MLLKQTPESVVAGLAGWENATIRELSGGLTNRALLLECDGRKAVLKIDEQRREAPFNTRQQEALIQNAAVEHGLANAVILATDTVYVTEYVEGVVWCKDWLESEPNLDSLAAALRRVHALPLTGRTFDVVGFARQYVRRIENATSSVDTGEISECMRAIEAGAPQASLCCCHNDLVVENIINTPELRFLDWEYACDNDPLFDLATIVAHHKLSAAQANYLLDAYFDGQGMRWREHLTRQTRVYEALNWLWQTARDALPAIP